MLPVDPERGIGYYLENWSFIPEEEVMKQINSRVGEPPVNIWTDLVKNYPDIELYPNERPKSFTNMVHELLNWLQCYDDGWDSKSSPEYGAPKLGQVPAHLVEVMQDFFEEHISKDTIETLRKVKF